MVETNDKQGFLAPEFKGRFKPGDSIPFLDELGIENRVGEQGEVQWALFDRDTIWLDFTYPYRDHLIEKEERVRHALFKMWHLFMRALLGNPVGDTGNEDLVITIPAPGRAGELPSYWESAPRAVQKGALFSAAKYLEPQLRDNGQRTTDYGPTT